MRSGARNGTSGTLKFLCSYGGKILPRQTDGKLRYVGGLTRVLAVERSVSFSGMFFVVFIDGICTFCGFFFSSRCLCLCFRFVFFL